MDIIVDLDGTICNEGPVAQRSLATPLPGARKALQRLKEKKHTIIIYSGRPWSEYLMTEDWLLRHKIPYDRLILGKPIGDIWVDDRALGFSGNWTEILTKIDKKK